MGSEAYAAALLEGAQQAQHSLAGMLRWPFAASPKASALQRLLPSLARGLPCPRLLILHLPADGSRPCQLSAPCTSQVQRTTAAAAAAA